MLNWPIEALPLGHTLGFRRHGFRHTACLVLPFRSTYFMTDLLSLRTNTSEKSRVAIQSSACDCCVTRLDTQSTMRFTFAKARSVSTFLDFQPRPILADMSQIHAAE